MLTFLTIMTIVLLVIVATYAYLIFRRPETPAIQRKPLLGARGHGYADMEFGEELTFDLQEPEYHLPQTYDESNAVLLAKDPHWLYAYWEIGPDTRKTFRDELHDPDAWSKTSLNLRVYNTTHDSVKRAPYFDIPIYEDAANWYIKVGKPRNSFVVEVGRMRNEHFYPLVRSNQITMPADSVSEIIDPEWPPSETIWKTLHSAISPLTQPAGSAHMTTGEKH